MVMVRDDMNVPPREKEAGIRGFEDNKELVLIPAGRCSESQVTASGK
jgi:hypothetical protein